MFYNKRFRIVKYTPRATIKPEQNKTWFFPNSLRVSTVWISGFKEAFSNFWFQQILASCQWCFKLVFTSVRTLKLDMLLNKCCISALFTQNPVKRDNCSAYLGYIAEFVRYDTSVAVKSAECQAQYNQKEDWSIFYSFRVPTSKFIALRMKT